VIATSSKDENLARVNALGAWEEINYTKHPDWEKVVLKLTDGKGVDRLLDVIGGDGLDQSIAATRVGGHSPRLDSCSDRRQSSISCESSFGRPPSGGLR
jgi:NADPH:quinone reductase-like Zn-dependent oxidoreductase